MTASVALYWALAFWFTVILVIAVLLHAPLGIIVPIGWAIGFCMSRALPDGRRIA